MRTSCDKCSEIKFNAVVFEVQQFISQDKKFIILLSNKVQMHLTADNDFQLMLLMRQNTKN